MANDFHGKFKANVNEYRSSYSQIPNKYNLHLNIGKQQSQYQHSYSFNDYLTRMAHSTPLCSDEEDFNDTCSDSESGQSSTKWYMAFPDNNTNNTITQKSEPFVNNINNISSQQQTDLSLAKTKIFNNNNNDRHKKQLYSEGDGGCLNNSTRTISVSGSEGNMNEHTKEIDFNFSFNFNDNQKVGITLMGLTQNTNDNTSTSDNDTYDTDTDMFNINNKSNITLMGNDTEKIQFEIKNENNNDKLNIGITLMGGATLKSY